MVAIENLTSNHEGGTVLTSDAAERLVESLQAMGIEQVGSAAWMRQHMKLQKLNLQAHHCVQTDSDNFILEHAVTFDKLPMLVHELIVAETWGEQIFPRICEAVAKVAPIKAYHIIYQEATVCNLLEVLLYHDYALESCQDSLLDLIDYCCRKLVWLQSNASAGRIKMGGRNMKNTEQGTGGGLEEQQRSLLFGSAVAAVSITRFICEHASKLPVSVAHRITDVHDVLCLVTPLIENPPWVHRNTDTGVWSKYNNNEWETVEPEDLLLLTPLEAQPWLIAYNLMLDEGLRSRYHFNTFRKDNVIRIRKYLNETLVDQLPVLSQVQRYIDELSIMNAPPPTNNQMSSLFVVEQVAEYRDSILGKSTFSADAAAQECLSRLSETPESKDDPIIAELADLYSDDSVEALLSKRSSVDENTDNANNKTNNDLEDTLDTALEMCTLVLNLTHKNSETTWQITMSAPKGSTFQKTSYGDFRRVYMGKAQQKDGSNVLLNGDNMSCVAMLSCGDKKTKVEAKGDISCGAMGWVKLGSLGVGLVVQMLVQQDESQKLLRLADVFVSFQSAVV